MVLSEDNLKKLETDISSHVMRVHSSGIEKKGGVGGVSSEGQILALLSFSSLNLYCFAFGFFLFLFGNSDL